MVQHRIDCENPSPEFLAFIFGTESAGNTPLERARTSSRNWVRSQDELSIYEPEIRNYRANLGLILNSEEALSIFGIKVLAEAIEYGSAILVVKECEPAASLKRVRERLGLSPEDLAKKSGLCPELILKAEDHNYRSLMWDLAKICQVLGIDVRSITVQEFS
jgi:DNA-binding XRE family transcriptional regulator